jgi:hypothetical protein
VPEASGSLGRLPDVDVFAISQQTQQ